MIRDHKCGWRRRKTPNDTGFTGVTKIRGVNLARPYKAQIRWGKKTLFLGYFDTAEKAHQAYCSAEQEYYPERNVYSD